jgi:hypothetical protein
MTGGCAALLLFAIAGCGRSSDGGAGTGGSGEGGLSGSGGSTEAGGGAGGSSTLGTDSASGGSGGRASGGAGGRATGGMSEGTGGVSGGSVAGGSGGRAGSGGGTGGRGTGGASGVGGVTSSPDAAMVEVGRPDGRIGTEAGRDVAMDVPPPLLDASDASGTDGSCVPDYACQPVAPNTGDPYADCVARVNQFRACVCLPPLARWTAGEACADQDAEYDSTQNTAHAGANANICDWGNAQNECPDWKRQTPASVVDGCLQMMFDEGPPPTGSCTGQCYSDHGHYINMTGTKYKSGVACGFYTTASGSVWAVQNFK